MEVGNFLKKWTAGFDELFPGRGKSQEDRLADVERYFALSGEIESLKGRVRNAKAGFIQEPDLVRLEEAITTTEKQRDKLEPDVEETIESLITSRFKGDGVHSNFLWWSLLWPPVDFRLDEVPKLLVVSPRDRIANINRKLLRPHITTEDRRQVEAAVDARNLSSLVVSIGGVATYPSLIPEGASLRQTLRLAAHEWTHHYLFFHPLGRGYNSNGDMTTLNETVADVVGDEVGDAIYFDVFATAEERQTEERRGVENPASGTLSADESAFDFSVFMRATRVKVDELLAAGEIAEAEAYMEQRRLELAEHGHFFRKINQAFFAFHGSYASRPESTSPIGGQVDSVRGASANVGHFLSRVNRYASYESFVRDLPALTQPSGERS